MTVDANDHLLIPSAEMEIEKLTKALIFFLEKLFVVAVASDNFVYDTAIFSSQSDRLTEKKESLYHIRKHQKEQQQSVTSRENQCLSQIINLLFSPSNRVGECIEI